MNTNKKKEAASFWFKSLRDQFCEAFEKIDQKGKFERKGNGWDIFPSTRTRLEAKFGCYRILDILLNFNLIIINM